MKPAELIVVIDAIKEKTGLTLQEIADKCDISRSHLSTILNSKEEKEVSDTYMRKLRTKFPVFFLPTKTNKSNNKANGQKDPSSDISALIKSNADLAESNKALAFSHAELVLMLKGDKKWSSFSPQGQRTNVELTSFLMALAGVDKEAQKSLSDEELIVKIEELGKEIAAQARKNRQSGKHVQDKKDK